MAQRITIDPVTRIEGHLRIDCEIDNGKVSKAWSSGQMWRGIELIVKDRDPRDAWVFAQRICGVCTTVHAIASVRAVENALDLEVPVNAQLIRNMIITAHGIHDHIVHFYQLSALDWVDITSALKANPKKAASLAQSLSDWRHNDVQVMRETQRKLQGIVDSGQLGIFANGYWGHPGMKLPPEVNLLAAVHYLQALEVQRRANEIVTVLGSKTPHIQNLAVGGVANPINLDSQSTLTLERLMHIKASLDELEAFIYNGLLVDVAAVGAMYAEWTGYGAGVTDYLSVPDLPMDPAGTDLRMPGGYIPGGDLDSYRAITRFGDPTFRDGVAESSKHAWYEGDSPLHPWDGDTSPEYTDFQDDGQYSWIKAPTFEGRPAQVGPLANLLCGLAAGDAKYEAATSRLLSNVKSVLGEDLPLSALHSTIGRHAARAVRCSVLFEHLREQWQALMDNIGSGDYDTFNAPEFPKGEVRGFGFHEAPRGVLSHWVVIENGLIKNYQAVVPSTWNAGPRNADDAPGPYEQSLLDQPVEDPEQPLEVLRTVHSFDPCIACAIHLHDEEAQEIVKVKAL